MTASKIASAVWVQHPAPESQSLSRLRTAAWSPCTCTTTS